MKFFSISQYILLILFSPILLLSQLSDYSYPKNIKAGFNYVIQSLEFQKERTGKTILKIHYQLVITDNTERSINMNHNIRVTKNGREIKTFEQNVRKENAYTCAVTCKGSCPSILGAGKCIDCACNYDNFLSVDPGKLRSGDRFKVTISPARRGVNDERKEDNSKSLEYTIRLNRR